MITLEISQKQNDLPQTPRPEQVEEMIECYQKLVASSNSQAMLKERVMNARDEPQANEHQEQRPFRHDSEAILILCIR
jgi:hypothetical protein